MQSVQAPEASKSQQVQHDQVSHCCSWCSSGGGWSCLSWDVSLNRSAHVVSSKTQNPYSFLIAHHAE